MSSYFPTGTSSRWLQAWLYSLLWSLERADVTVSTVLSEGFMECACLSSFAWDFVVCRENSSPSTLLLFQIRFLNDKTYGKNFWALSLSKLQLKYRYLVTRIRNMFYYYKPLRFGDYLFPQQNVTYRELSCAFGDTSTQDFPPVPPRLTWCISRLLSIPSLAPVHSWCC